MWEQNHKASGTYTVNHAYVVTFIKIAANPEYRADRKHKKKNTGRQNSSFPKEQIKNILADINPFNQNNDQMRISHKIL